MAENSPETPQVKQISWQQMHDGLFWPRYDPLLPGKPSPEGLRRAEEIVQTWQDEIAGNLESFRRPLDALARVIAAAFPERP